MSLRGRGIAERKEWLYNQPNDIDDKIVCKYNRYEHQRSATANPLATKPRLANSVSIAIEDNNGGTTEKESTINSGEVLSIVTRDMIRDTDEAASMMPIMLPAKGSELQKIGIDPLNDKGSEENGENLIVSTSSNNSSGVLPSSSSPASPLVKYVDITDYLNMPQSDAARRLGIPTSTLSKRWKEAARNRKWPFRSVSKLDKEIMTLLHNIPKGADSAQSVVPPPEIQVILSRLLRKRQEELKPVFIRLDVRGSYE